jgi:hypothetical protein
MDLKQINEAMDHRITGGTEYGWSSWPDARFLEYESEYAYVSVVFNSKSQMIYQAEVSCKSDMWTNEPEPKPYRWLNPHTKQAMLDEAASRGVDKSNAWDDVNWVDLETSDDFLEKAKLIFNGVQNFDTRIKVPVEIDDTILFKLMVEAHENDVTFNQLVAQILRKAIDNETKKLNEHNSK